MMTPLPAPAYPETATTQTTDVLHGETIADPYRWLENDVRNDAEVAQWVEQQNAVTQAYLQQLPGRAELAARIAELTDFQRVSTPVKRGGRYFQTMNSGLQNQSPLYVRDSLTAEPRLLLDPNAWADDGATALADWSASPDGGKLLYAVQDGGTDWRIIRALDVTTGQPLQDEIRWAKFTGLAWVGNDGFLYSRFPEPEAGQDFQALNYNQAVYYHRLGTPQSEDQLVYSTPDHPKQGHTASVTSDGKWAIVTSSLGTDARYEVHAIDLSAREAKGWQPVPLVTGFENSWSLVDGVGDRLWFVTNQDAPMYRVVAVNMAGDRQWQPVVAQRDSVIESAALVGDRLILSYLEDAKSAATVFDRQGTEQARLPLPGIGSMGGISGEPGDDEAFYSFSSFNQPAAISRLAVGSLESTPFFQPRLTFDPANFVVEQRFYQSKDGTRVPMFVMRRKDVAAAGQPVPTLLYGYGGFDISLTPGFAASRLAWVEAGGAWALANIRGGGEYGKAWHDGGRLANKQNVFDDFIAAGEFLKAEGVTSQEGLAIQGGSNGGLLVGAVVNQRPDLFAAGNAAVGVMDMLRFDRWTAGRYWVDDYGYPDRADDFRTLRAYSPLHNVKAGTPYPALLVTTADTDDRVVPGHSFKYVSTLQASDLGPRPQLIRIETRAGHGAGKPTDKAIAESADILAFLAHWTGLQLPPATN
ncbi:prolyl oligopeptidase family serine peptidase [Croceibacterium sp. TMG7-5b_MA50]|uniref:prolyl oligopeptidase family serine peptidase n=1 Tax=Croceibacterium sp. TMG7-5b_MA50 TaxID=3121290 RepID=UPI00322151F0